MTFYVFLLCFTRFLELCPKDRVIRVRVSNRVRDRSRNRDRVRLGLGLGLGIAALGDSGPQPKTDSNPWTALHQYSV